MSILSFIIIVALVGVLLWAINTYLPMDAGVKKFLSIAVVVILIVWLLQILGLFSALDMPIGHIR